MKTKAVIMFWKQNKGFGFCQTAEGRAFVHATSLTPRPARGADLNGKDIVVEETTRDSKGLRVIRAVLGITEEKTSFRFLPDGRLMQTRALVLGDKTLEVLEPEKEVDASAEKIAEEITRQRGSLKHPIVPQIDAVINDLTELERRRVFFGINSRDMRVLVRESLARKLEANGITRISAIPADFTVSADEVEPELARNRESLGTIEIPGLGRKLASGPNRVTLTTDEVKLVNGMPQGIRVTIQNGRGSTPLLTDASSDDWPALRAQVNRLWVESQRLFNGPKDIPIQSPGEADLSEFPTPVKFGEDLDGNSATAYPFLTEKAVHSMDYNTRGQPVYSKGWGFSWCDSAEEAETRTKETTVKAEKLAEARRFRVRYTGGAEPKKLPTEVSPPPPFDPTVEELLVHLGVRERITLDRTIGPKVVAPSWYKYESPDTMGTRSDHQEGSVTWVFPEGESVRVPASIIAEDLLKGGSRHTPVFSHGRGIGGGGAGGYSGYGPVALSLGCSSEQIQEASSWMDAERERREAAALRDLQAWFSALESHLAFHCLSPKTVELCQRIAGYYGGYQTLQENLGELEAEWGKALATVEQEKSGDILSNWTALWRTGGATCCGRAYVIRPDGTLRDADRQEGLRKPTRAFLTWELVASEELAILWEKAYTAAPHEFSVAKLPKGGCTKEQLETVARLEGEIAGEWDGSRGMSSGSSSPPIGKGWGLTPGH